MGASDSRLKACRWNFGEGQGLNVNQIVGNHITNLGIASFAPPVATVADAVDRIKENLARFFP
jgi:hypothetical protein